MRQQLKAERPGSQTVGLHKKSKRASSHKQYKGNDYHNGKHQTKRRAAIQHPTRQPATQIPLPPQSHPPDSSLPGPSAALLHSPGSTSPASCEKERTKQTNNKQTNNKQTTNKQPPNNHQIISTAVETGSRVRETPRVRERKASEVSRRR